MNSMACPFSSRSAPRGPRAQGGARRRRPFALFFSAALSPRRPPSSDLPIPRNGQVVQDRPLPIVAWAGIPRVVHVRRPSSNVFGYSLGYSRDERR